MTQPTDRPAEHCGHQPDPVIGQPTECVLRPGHSGSHANETGMRWWMNLPLGVPAEVRAAVLREAADAIDAETNTLQADRVLEPDRFRSCRDASAQLRRLARKDEQ
ncbi:hypothetical protein MIU24_32485 [Streptomyces venezuelae]|uniref:hypothetical protein n=1 Tax=Streptomyces sp. B6(2022) TaxID=3404749 RepID=UPI00311D81F4